jgi:hypothetical protein
MLRFSPDTSDTYWKEKRLILKELFDDSYFENDSIKKSLVNICKNAPNDWRRYFVKNHQLIKYCEQGFIYTKGDDEDVNIEVELFSASQMNHYHINMHVLNFYHLYILKNSAQLKPFSNFNYEPIKKHDDWSYIILNDYCFKKKYYNLKVYRFEKGLGVDFGKDNGKKNLSEFNDEIVKILEDNLFKWYEDDNVFHRQFKNEKNTIDTILKICKTLNDL